MSVTTPPQEKTSPLGDLRSRHAALQEEIRGLIDERNRLYGEFQTKSNDVSKPSDEEVTRFEARRSHDDLAVRPTEGEIRDFEARLNSVPTEDEVRKFNGEHDSRRNVITNKMSELSELSEQLEQETELSHGRDVAARASRGLPFERIEAQRDPLTYREDNQNQVSYFLDLAAMNVPDVRARDFRMEGFEERLQRHAKEMSAQLPERWSARKAQAEERIERAENEFRDRARVRRGGFEVSPFERRDPSIYRREMEQAEMEQRAPSRIVGQGGYAVPPLWLVDEYIPALRPGRVAAGLCRQMPLPAGTDSINIPRLLTPTLTGIQGADAAPVVSRDFSDTFQQANVKTIAGQEDVPIQLIEQSPGQILDRVLMTDLISDYNKQVDVQVIQGSGVGAPLSGGQVVGLYPASNWGASQVPTGTTFGLNAASGGTNVPYVPPQAEFFQFLGAMASKTSYSRFNLTDFNYLMHPRRHFWSATGLDVMGRPLGSDDGFGPHNSHEIEINPAPYEGYAGRVPFGPRVYIDANVPATDNGLGALGGTNDVVIGAIWDDLWLFEGDLRTRVLTEVLSGTLELRFQVYAYIAFLARYGVSIAVGYGSAMSAPTTVNGIAF